MPTMVRSVVDVGGIRFGEHAVVVADGFDGTKAVGRIARVALGAPLSAVFIAARAVGVAALIIEVTTEQDVADVVAAVVPGVDVVLQATGRVDAGLLDVLGAHEFAVWVDDAATIVERLEQRGQTRIFVRSLRAIDSRWPVVIDTTDIGALTWADGVCVAATDVALFARVAFSIAVERSSTGTRDRVDALDALLMSVVAERARVGAQLVAMRHRQGGAASDPIREAVVVQQSTQRLIAAGLSPAEAPSVALRICTALFAISKRPADNPSTG
jgi:chorismate mutase